MSSRILRSVIITLSLAAGFTAGQAIAQGGRMASDQRVYGHQLMTEQERLQYQERMRSARTDEERARVREEHHAAMRERARAQGIELPDEPPERGMGRGPGGGMGSGAGGGRGAGGNR